MNTTDIYDTEWNEGYQAFVDGLQAYGNSTRSDAYNAGYHAALQNADDDLAIAELDCIADYDANGGEAA